MSDLTRRPDEMSAPVAISKTELKPVMGTDELGLWRKFADFVRQNIGLKPLDLAKRFAETEACKREVRAESVEVDQLIFRRLA